MQPPQWLGSVRMLAQAPLQQAAPRPRHGAAVQEPQWRMSALRSVQIPVQQAGVSPVHFLPQSAQLFGSVRVFAQVPEQQVGLAPWHWGC